MAVVAVVASVGGFIFIFCFRWWWPITASRGCGFAKKGVGFQRKGETERKKQRIKKQYLNEVLKKLESLMYNKL